MKTSVQALLCANIFNKHVTLPIKLPIDFISVDDPLYLYVCVCWQGGVNEVCTCKQEGHCLIFCICLRREHILGSWKNKSVIKMNWMFRIESNHNLLTSLIGAENFIKTWSPMLNVKLTVLQMLNPNEACCTLSVCGSFIVYICSPLVTSTALAAGAPNPWKYWGSSITIFC